MIRKANIHNSLFCKGVIKACHSEERSDEESQLIKDERPGFFASLRMTYAISGELP
jgi:hypothetical protein